MRERDQHRIAEWIGDAFALLCVRVDGLSAAEAHVRRGFEEILRQLGSSPLRIAARVPLPPHRERPVSASDLRYIVRALDACLSVFERYQAGLTSSQRGIRHLVQATRRFAEEALQDRRRDEAPTSAATASITPVAT